MMSYSGNPLVTVVITTYRRPKLAQRAVKSVLAQNYQPVDIIVVEDGSDNGIEAWLQAEGLSHIRYMRHRENMGLAAARNTGLLNARGEYIAYLDDDDEWLPEKLKKQVDLAETKRNAFQIFYCGTISETEGGQVVRVPNLSGPIYGAMMSGWTPPQSACLFRKQALEWIGGFDENLVSGIDHDIWMECAVAGYKVDFIEEALVIVGTHNNADRMTLNTDRRIMGIKKFLSKWEHEIKIALGQKG